MREHGFLLGNDATYDAFNADARDLYWKQAYEGWWKHGIDAWWCDCTEPFEADWKGGLKPEPWKRVQINTGESKTFLDPEHINAYSIHHSRGIYEHQRAVTSDKRVVNLTRSGFPGQQRYGAITWSGDIAANWKTLKQQIADGLNFCVTGNPKWTLDIGAFFVAPKEQWFWRGDYPDGCEDPGYRELYTRWIQFGAFLPMMRSHGTDTPREPWRFGGPGDASYDTIVKFIHLRYRLLPYIYSLAAMETRDDYTMMRMLAFDFRHDARVYHIADQYMFGPSVMVCPVTEAGAKQRSVYLPSGCDWYDFWTGRRYTGGQTIRAEAPIEILPLFVRAGSILPMGPLVQHSGEALDAPIELRIYAGPEGQFNLYEDEGDNYNFELGRFTTIPIEWNDREHRLTIAPRSGSFTGAVSRREFHATRVVEGRGVGVEPTKDADHIMLCADPFRGEARWK
jgi:alpha-D-xyloside xylohydrolase